MKSKRKLKKRIISMILIVAMLAPSWGSLVVHAAEAISSLPRYVDFS